MRFTFSLIVVLLPICMSLNVIPFDSDSPRSWSQTCDITAKLSDASSCIANKLPRLLLVNRAVLLRIISGSKTPTFCSLLPELKECWNQVVSDVKGCLPKAGKLDVELQRDAVYRGFNFLCKNDGEMLNELLASKKCLELEEGMEACNTQDLVNALMNYGNTTVFNSGACSMLDATKDCTIKEIAMRCDSRQAAAVQGFLDAMQMPCNNHTNTTPRSLTRVKGLGKDNASTTPGNFTTLKPPSSNAATKATFRLLFIGLLATISFHS